MNIYQRINEVRKSIGYVQKDKAVSTGGGSYKAVTHDAVTGMIRQFLIEQGIVIVPDLVTGIFYQKEEGAKQRLYEATYQVAFVNAENPEEKVFMQVSAHALDNGDKAPGKALSYATKYAMLKMFNIETGEDEESRYQQEEFDIAAHVDVILASVDLDDLKNKYSEAYKIADSMRNKDAMKALIVAKDKAKSALTNQAGSA